MATWQEDLHPRAGKGTPTGGQFVSKGGLSEADKKARGGWALDDDDKVEISRYRQVNLADVASIPEIDLRDAAERQIIREYTGFGGVEINQALRSGVTFEMADYDRIFERNRLSENLILHRFYHRDGPVAEMIAKLEPGDALLDKGLISTTLLDKNEFPKLGYDGELRILAPAGSRAAYIGTQGDPEHPGEHEVLIDRNSRLVYMGEDDDGARVFKLEQEQQKFAYAPRTDDNVHIIEGYGKPFPVYVNPSRKDIEDLAKESDSKSVRVVRAKNGDLYVWDADMAIHASVQNVLDLKSDDWEVLEMTPGGKLVSPGIRGMEPETKQEWDQRVKRAEEFMPKRKTKTSTLHFAYSEIEPEAQPETQKLIDYVEREGSDIMDMTGFESEGVVGYLTPDGRSISIGGLSHQAAAEKSNTTQSELLDEGTARIYASAPFLGIEIRKRPTEAQIKALQAYARTNTYEKFSIDTWPTRGVDSFEGHVTPQVVRDKIDEAFPPIEKKDGWRLRNAA